jgi:hypothetical protein
MSASSLTYAIIENDTVINVIIAENLETAQELFPNNEVLDTANDPYLVMFAFKENSRWFPQKPQPLLDPETNTEQPYLWHETTNSWLTQKEINLYDELIAQNITLPIVE